MMFKLFKVLAIFSLFLVSSCITPKNSSKTKAPSITAKWAGVKQLGSVTTNPKAKTITHDASGNTFVAGYVSGSHNLDGSSLVGSVDLYLVKYDSAGSKKWTKTFGAPGLTLDIGQKSVLVDSSGNLYIVFTSNGAISSDLAKISDIDIYVAKIDTNGNQLWMQNYGSSSPTGGIWAQGAVINSDNQVVIAGWADGPFYSTAMIGVQDSFLLCLNSSGTKVWSRLVGTSSLETVFLGIAVDANNNLYAAGSITRVDSGENAMVMKFNSTGSTIWTNSVGTTGNYIRYSSIVVESTGQSYLTGLGSGDFNGSTLVGATDVFVTKINSNGVTSWSSTLGNTPSTTLISNTIVSDGTYLYVSGTTDGDFVGVSLLGYKDVFIVKYNLSGSKIWTKQLAKAFTYISQGSLDIRYDQGSSDYSFFIVGDTNTALGSNTQVGPTDMFIAKYDSTGASY